jgi:hypothetical protein
MTARTTKPRITVASIKPQESGVQREFLPLGGFGNMRVLSMGHYVRQK